MAEIDLAEGKRLLSIVQETSGQLDAIRDWIEWLAWNAESLIAAAEDAEKLRPLVDAAETMVREYDEEITAHVARHGNVAGTEYGATRRVEPLRKALAALTQPEPTPGASSSS